MVRKAWPIASLLLNVILLGAIAVTLAKREPNKVDSKPDNLPVATPLSSESAKVHKPRSPARIASSDANEPDWRDWLSQLRASGMPDRVLAGLVVSDFESRWEKQRREMQKRYDRGDLDDDEMSQFVEQHDATREQELKDALGADGFRQWDKERVLADFDLEAMNLAASETDELYQMRKDLAQKERYLAQSHQDGEIDQAELNAQESAAQKEFDQKLKAMLGDDRYAALAESGEGMRGALVRTLKKLNASEAQFEAVLQAQKRWSESRNRLESLLQESKDQSKSYEEEMHAIDAVRDAEYQRVLGTNGFDTLQRSRDGRYQALQRYAPAWQLSADDIDYIYRAMQFSQKSVEDYRRQARGLEEQGNEVDWPKVEANLKEFSEQTEQSLRTQLGDERFNRLQQNGVLSSEE